MSHIDYDQIADSIAKIGDVSRKLAASGLSKRAILALLKEGTGLPKVTIEKVLDGLAELSLWSMAKRPPKRDP